MTRLDALHQRLEMGLSIQIFVTPQDLRDLLAVADAAKHYNDTGALYPLIDAIEKLDAPVGDEGA